MLDPGTPTLESTVAVGEPSTEQPDGMHMTPTIASASGRELLPRLMSSGLSIGGIAIEVRLTFL
jgi:hypothetical protein